MQDNRSRRIVFVAHCLLNQNAKAAGLATWSASVRPILDCVQAADVGIVQLPCPECEHFGPDRPMGEDTKEQYDCPEYRTTCSRLCQQVVRQLQQYLQANYRVCCILGIEGSPSCSVATVPTRNGSVAGSGVFFEVLLEALLLAGIQVPLMGVPEVADLSKTVSRLQQLLSRQQA